MSSVLPPRNRRTDRQQYYGALRLRTKTGEFDLALMAANMDKYLLLGGDFAGWVYDAGMRGEFLYSQGNGNKGQNFVRCTPGADQQFAPEFYALLEYRFNGEDAGTPKDDDYLHDMSGYLAKCILHLSLRRAYFCLRQ